MGLIISVDETFDGIPPEVFLYIRLPAGFIFNLS